MTTVSRPIPSNQGLSNGINVRRTCPGRKRQHQYRRQHERPVKLSDRHSEQEAKLPNGVDITDYGNGWLKVTWNAVTGDAKGGSDIKNYIVQWKSGTDDYSTTKQATPTESPYTITNLTNGTLYTVRVRAVNETYRNDPSDDPDDGSNEDTETPRTIPEKPDRSRSHFGG